MSWIGKFTLLFMFFIALFSCTGNKNLSDSIIRLDVSKSYPEKIVTLEDIADVKYVQMEFQEDYLFRGNPSYISSSTIIIKGGANSNDFLFFTSEGKPKSKFNHHGQGPGEYLYTSSIVYDETEEKLFILSNNKILVYSSDGEYNYSLPLPENTRISHMVDYDKESLLIYHESNSYSKSFVRISKKDASVIEEIDIPDRKEISLRVTIRSGEMVSIYIAPLSNIVKYNDGFLLTDHSSDTVIFYGRNNELNPVLVRTPPIFEMDPYVYINSYVEAGDYLFLQKVTVKLENERVKSDFLMINKYDQSVYKQKIFLKEFKDKEVNLSPEVIRTVDNSGIGFIRLSLDELRVAYDENKLSGKLKELVEASDEDSNDIFMILNFKKN